MQEGAPKIENDLEQHSIKEGVEFVFAQYPELQEVGTKEQYSEYLDTVFPESKIKDIVYHGTSTDRSEAILKEGFDINKSGNNLGYIGKITSFFTERSYTNNFAAGAVIASLVNITSEYIDNLGNLTEEGLHVVKQKLIDSHIIPFVRDIEKLDKEIDLANEGKFQNANNKVKLTNYLSTSTGKSHDVFNSILIELGVHGLKRNDLVVDMLSTDQIYVLGSKQDMEKFKEFVNK